MKNVFILRNPKILERIIDYLYTLEQNDDKPKWQVTISKYVKSRTKPQNRLYWEWLGIISLDIGYTKNELHEMFGSKFLPKTVITGFDGEEISRPVSTTDLSIPEFAQYLLEIEQMMSEMNIYLPHPEDLKS